jgi:hypothetical protein
MQAEDIHPAISLKQFNLPVRPSESRVEPLGPRDLFDDGVQIYRLLNQYQFSSKCMNVPPESGSTELITVRLCLVFSAKVW